MNPRPPRSALFPYATLFRSSRPRPARNPRPMLIGHIAVREPFPWQDRKSTRLNSSHSQISYAVFCLKTNNDRENANACNCEPGDVTAVVNGRPLSRAVRQKL